MVEIVAGTIKYDLTDLRGISSAKKQKLFDVGIYKVDDLTSSSSLQRRKLKGQFTGQLLDRLQQINQRGRLRDPDLTQSAISKREQLREQRKQELDSGPDPVEQGFSTAQRPDEEFEQAFETFTSEFDSPNDPIPVADIGREADDVEGSAQPLINTVTSRVNFTNASQPQDFQRVLEEQTEEFAKKRRGEPASPGEQRDAFVSFVDDRFGLGPDMVSLGAFEAEKSDFEKAKETNQGRSERARDVDKQKRAPITTDYERWAANPRELDFPGVDTPRNTPEKEERDLPFE